MLARSPLRPPGPVGEVTASIEALGYESTEQASAIREVALGPAATFEGFETEREAAVAASGGERVGVVVADAEGRFHAYETDLEPTWGPILSHVIPYDLDDARVVRWANLEMNGGAASLEQQITHARSLTSHPLARKKLEARPLYLGLLETAVGLDRSEIHDSTGGKPVPGKLSFNLDYMDANAHAGVAGEIPSDRTTPLPEPTLELGPLAFEDLPSLRATLLHEFTHLNHHTQTVAAVERWRATTTDGPFLNWLQRELKAGRIDAIDFSVIKEHVEGGTETTESLSYLISFVSSYHLRDLAEYPSEDADGKLFAKLDQLASDWVGADHVVQDYVADQLNAYRDTLDDAHRERINAFIAKRSIEHGPRSRVGPFWGRLR